MHLEALIEQIWRCTWRPWSSEFGGRDQASLEMLLEAVIKRVCRCTWRPWSCELGGCNRASLEIHLEAGIERDWTSTGRQSMDTAPGAETLFNRLITRNHGNVTRWLYLWALMQSWLKAVDRVGRHARSWSYIQGSTPNHENERKTNNHGWMLYSVYAVLGVCCTRCILYSVSTHDHGTER